MPARCSTSGKMAIMHDESIIVGPVRLSRTLILAAILASVGLLRLASDLLTDVDPCWASWLGGAPLLCLFVRVLGGSLCRNLNLQYLNFLAIPCGLSLGFLLHCGFTGGVPL